MLRCPKCNRTYQDDMQKFCTHDGGRLVPDIERPKSFDPNATVTTDGSAYDIPAAPSSTAPTVDNLGATMAAPPPSSPTSGIRSSDTAPPTFSETSRLGQSPPDESTLYPALPKLAQPSPPPSMPASPADLRSSTPQAPTVLTQMPPQSAHLPFQAAPVSPASQAPPVQSQSAPLPAAPKKSKLGFVLTIVGVLLLVVLVGGGVASYFIFIKNKGPRRGREVTVEPKIKNTGNSNEISNANSNQPMTPPTVDAPPNSFKFENTSSSLDGKLAQHYVDFYFYYPKSWQKSAKAGVAGSANFVEVGRVLPPDYTQENLTVSWYDSKGTVEADLAGRLPALIRERDASWRRNLVDYKKVSEGKTTINGIEGYEFRFAAMALGTDKGDFNIWGRVVFLPPGDEKSTKGVTLYMLTTSLAPELKSVDDVGLKGELPIILNSFTLGKS